MSGASTDAQRASIVFMRRSIVETVKSTSAINTSGQQPRLDQPDSGLAATSSSIGWVRSFPKLSRPDDVDQVAGGHDVASQERIDDVAEHGPLSFVEIDELEARPVGLRSMPDHPRLEIDMDREALEIEAQDGIQFVAHADPVPEPVHANAIEGPILHPMRAAVVFQIGSDPIPSVLALAFGLMDDAQRRLFFTRSRLLITHPISDTPDSASTKDANHSRSRCRAPRPRRARMPGSTSRVPTPRIGRAAPPANRLATANASCPVESTSADGDDGSCRS